MRITYQLTPEELTEIERAIKQDKRPEVRQRAAAIRLLHLKYRPESVAELQLVSLPTIYNWHRLWREKGLDGLVNRPRLGRVPKADAAYCQKLDEALEKEPSDYGYGFTIWTTDRLRQHLEKETGLLLSNSRFRALMKKLGYRYRRPKYDLSHLQDTEARAEAEKVLEKLKKRASKTISGSSLWTK
jgi:transposase